MAKVPSSSGTNPDPSGIEENPENPNPESGADDPADPTPAASKQTVSYDSHQKLLKEKKAIQARLADFEKKEKEAAEAKAKADGNYKQLLEERDKKIAELEGTVSEGNKRWESTAKLNAFLDSVDGEIPKQYWSLIDIENIAINPETELPDEMSVKEAVKKFSKTYPDVVKKRTGSKLPNTPPQGANRKLTVEAWKALPYKEKVARMGDVQTEN